MSQQAIGRILLMPKGEYNASTTYNMLDWVRYNGKAWVCKQDNTIGIAPSESVVWTMLVQDGSGGTGSGDMQKSVYDTDDDGVVDSAETISGLTASITQLNYLNTATSNIQTQLNGKVSDNPTFTQASSRTNVASGDSISTLFGKIMKWFSDLKDLAFIAQPTSSPTTKYLRGDGSWQTFPSIPTVNDATLTIQKNGTTVNTFTANASSNSTANIVTGEFIKTASVSSGTVTFTGVDDTGGTKGYDVFFDITSSSTNKSPYAKLTSISGEGTSNCTLTYQTDADDGTNTAHLYQYK